MKLAAAPRLTPESERRLEIELPDPCRECGLLLCLCGGTLALPRQRRTVMTWPRLVVTVAALASVAAGAAEAARVEYVVDWPATLSSLAALAAVLISLWTARENHKRGPVQAAREAVDLANDTMELVSKLTERVAEGERALEAERQICDQRIAAIWKRIGTMNN